MNPGSGSLGRYRLPRLFGPGEEALKGLTRGNTSIARVCVWFNTGAGELGLLKFAEDAVDNPEAVHDVRFVDAEPTVLTVVARFDAPSLRPDGELDALPIQEGLKVPSGFRGVVDALSALVLGREEVGRLKVGKHLLSS